MRINSISALIVAVLLLAGCATTSQPNQLAWFRLVGQLAAYDGATIRLRNHPEDRAAFAKAQAALQQFNAAEQWDPTMLVLLLKNNLPVNELKSDNAALIFTSALLIFQQATGPIEIRTPELVKAFAGGIDAGLTMALATQ